MINLHSFRVNLDQLVGFKTKIESTSGKVEYSIREFSFPTPQIKIVDNALSKLNPIEYYTQCVKIKGGDNDYSLYFDPEGKTIVALSHNYKPNKSESLLTLNRLESYVILMNLFQNPGTSLEEITGAYTDRLKENLKNLLEGEGNNIKGFNALQKDYLRQRVKELKSVIDETISAGRQIGDVLEKVTEAGQSNSLGEWVERTYQILGESGVVDKVGNMISNITSNHYRGLTHTKGKKNWRQMSNQEINNIFKNAVPIFSQIFYSEEGKVCVKKELEKRYSQSQFP